MTLEQFEHDECNRLKKENEELKERIAELEKSEKWIKFDPHNPKTFPPYQEFFLVYYDNKHVVEVRGCVHNSENGYKHLITAPSGDLDIKRVSHWRPLPKPPQTEEKK